MLTIFHKTSKGKQNEVEMENSKTPGVWSKLDKFKGNFDGEQEKLPRELHKPSLLWYGHGTRDLSQLVPPLPSQSPFSFSSSQSGQPRQTCDWLSQGCELAESSTTGALPSWPVQGPSDYKSGWAIICRCIGFLPGDPGGPVVLTDARHRNTDDTSHRWRSPTRPHLGSLWPHSS